MNQIALATRVVTALTLLGIALARPLTEDWCLGWQIAGAGMAFLVVGLLVMREVNRERVKEKHARAAQEQVEGQVQELGEGVDEIRSQQSRLRRDIMRSSGMRRLNVNRSGNAWIPITNSPPVCPVR